MCRVLVIDDDVLVRKTIQLVLEREGYVVSEASNGMNAMALMTREVFDIVVMDIIMPEQDGLETLVEIRRLPTTTKVLVMSGGGRTGNAEFLKAALMLGADEIVQKPFDVATLVNTIRSMTSYSSSLAKSPEWSRVENLPTARQSQVKAI